MRARFLQFIFWMALLALSSASANAQTSPDQMMQIMMSQPRMEIPTNITAVASFDPPIVKAGEKSIYRVSFNIASDSAAADVRWPEPLPAPTSLKLDLVASGHIMQPVAGGTQMFSTFNFDARSPKAGSFQIPEFTVEVYGKTVTVPAAQLEVSDDLATNQTARQLLIETSETNIFVGETFNVSVLLPSTQNHGVEGVGQLEIKGDGFIVQKTPLRQAIEPRDNVPTYIYETVATPITAGKLTLLAQGYTSGMQFSGPIVIRAQVSIPAGPPQYILLNSEPLMINVRSLPVENELPGFTGAIGNFTSETPRLSTNSIKLGEPLQLTVTVRGQKNLDKLTPPQPPHSVGWQFFSAKRGAVSNEAGATNQTVSFNYTLIPLTTNLQTTPAIPFSCFNPESGKYVNLTIPSLPVTIIAGNTNADSALMLAENNLLVDSDNAFSQLSQTSGQTIGSLVPLQLRGWFPVLQMMPVIGFCGLWFWDWRRRFLEQHPEIVRRRRARRELRRELRFLESAVNSNDVKNFIQHAVSAMQIASAPHYPAEPRALVCGDVLQILSPAEQQCKSGQIVRQFFAAADASSFATNSATQNELLTDWPALKEVLLELEARL